MTDLKKLFDECMHAMVIVLSFLPTESQIIWYHLTCKFIELSFRLHKQKCNIYDNIFCLGKDINLMILTYIDITNSLKFINLSKVLINYYGRGCKGFK